MAANESVDPKRSEQQWWTQAAAATDGERSDSATKAPSTYSNSGGDAAQPSGLTGMPTEFGRYRVRKQLGGGGMGAVYLVENTELKREEALKVPHFGVGGNPDVRERFLREARAAAQLDHPNLCPVYDVGTIDGVCFLTMRYLKGKLLSEFTGKPQPPRKAVEITAKLAQALESAHTKGVIHRDLKPNNVMMCPGVGPVVMDFGLAKQTKGEDQKLTQAGTTMGTPSYMPPEQIKGELDRLGPASDVYSLGVILFEMLTGRLPFKAATTAEVYGLVLHTEAPALSSLQPGLSPALDAICAKALAKTPESRYPSMKAFAAALINYLKTAPAGENAGNLTPTKIGSAEIFQSATVMPNQTRTAPPVARGGATQRVNQRPPSTNMPVAGRLANTQAAFSEAAEREGRSTTQRMGFLALVLAVLGAIGGVGYLVYAVNQKKAAPSADQEVVAASISLSDRGQAADTFSSPAPKAHISKEDAAKIETQIADPPAEDTPTADPPKGGIVGVNPQPRAAPPRPGGVVHRPPAPKPEPQKAPPPMIVEQPKADAPKPEQRDENTLLNEDFSGLEVGSRPKGWVGDAFGVETEQGRRCLEVIKETNALQFVKLPKAPLKGDFEIECEFRLGGANVRNGLFFGPNVPNGQEFHLDLASRSSPPVRIEVGYLGNVRLEAGQAKAAEGFKVFEPNTLRLTRKGDVYTVSINGRETVGRTIARKNVFQNVSIGLTGGKPATGGAFLACLYAVKITSAESVSAKPDETVKTPTAPPPALREDFSRAAVDSLPIGWTASKVANLAVRKLGDSAALELVNPNLGSDQATLPTVELNGSFYVDVTAVLTERDTAVEVFFKGPKTKALSVKLDYGGTVAVTGQTTADGSKAWIEAKPNILRIERSSKENDYVIKLNDAAVGSLPLTAAQGPFTRVDLAVIVPKDVKRESPRVTSVEIVPLEEAP